MKRSASTNSENMPSNQQQSMLLPTLPPASAVVGTEVQEQSVPSETMLPPSRSSSGHAPDVASFFEQTLTRQQSEDGSTQEQDEGDANEELRKLDADFQKNLQRAKKVFDNRMDNLQRSQIEREAQHKKTLEKHQKVGVV